MNHKNIIKLLVSGMILGSLLTIIGVYSLSDIPSAESGAEASNAIAKKPLYWVAPMNPNYKRDKPGKSPMGMDMIPVYAESASGDSGPGTIKISPEVVNNLGVRTATAKLKPLHLRIKTVGYVKYDEDQLVHIHPRVEGWIEKLFVKAEGDPVNKGQPLYEIYSPELVNAQEELVLALDRKNQRLLQAAQNRLKALQLPLNAIKRLRQTREVMQTVTFYAPQSGVVDNLNIRQGKFIKPGTNIMSIGAIKQVWVEAEVFERQASDVSVGVPVTMSLDYLPGREWLGKVDYIYPTLDIKTRTIKVRLRFENKDEVLKPNMFAQVIIHTKNTKKVVVVPKEAVIRTGNVNRLVLALGEGRFKAINVKVGRFDEQFAEILAGIKEGDRVVTSAQFLLDSESSKTSDFKRMNHEVSIDKSATAASVWVEATINNLMAEQRMVNLTHNAISEWDWPKMTMDFVVGDSVNISELKQGMTLHVEINKDEDEQYRVSNVHIRSSHKDNQDMDENIDHSQHKGMSEESINQSVMDQDNPDVKSTDKTQPETMSHEKMDHSKHNQ